MSIPASLRASTAQKNLIERLLKREEITTGARSERLGIMFRPVLRSYGATLPEDRPTVGEWLDGLGKYEAHKVIEHLTGNA